MRLRPRRRPRPAAPAQPSLLDEAPPDNAPLPDAPPVLKWRRGAYRVPNDAEVGQCQSCKADIIWTRTPKGVAIPLSVATIRTEADGVKTALPHFVDCKHGKEWSKKK